MPPHTTPVPGPGSAPGAPRWLGFLLLIPAVVAWLWTYLLPSFSVVIGGFQEGKLAGGDKDKWVGLDNYHVIGDYGAKMWLTMVLLGMVALVAAVVVAPGLAVLAHRSGTLGRRITLGLLALPLACYVPTALALGRVYTIRSSGAGGQGGLSVLLRVVSSSWFGILVAVATTAFLAALRSRRPERAVLVTGVVVALSVTAMAWQAFTAPVLTPTTDHKPFTPSGFSFGFLARLLRTGPASAANTIILVLVGLLGLAVVAVLLLTRARLEVAGASGDATASTSDGTGSTSDGTGARRPGPGAVAALAGALVLLLLALGYAHWPWLEHATGRPEGVTASTGTVLVDTWIPPLISAVVAVVLAAVAGYGIGALRPLGPRSELLLLPFAPWLFVTVGTLLPAYFDRAQDADQIDTFLGLIPPTWLSIPALVLFTLFFRGQAARAAERPGTVDFLGGYLLPALPLLGGVTLLTWLLQAQDLLWPTMIDAGDVSTGPLATAGWQGAAHPAYGDAMPLYLLAFFLIAFAAVQAGYLERLRLRLGAEPQDGAAGDPPPSQRAFQQNPAQPYPGQPYPGQQNPAQPGQQAPGYQPAPGQPYPGYPPAPGQPAQPYPGQQYPGYPPAPGQQHPGFPPAPGQPAQPYPGYPPAPGQPAQPYPGQQYPGYPPAPGQSYPGQPGAAQ